MKWFQSIRGRLTAVIFLGAFLPMVVVVSAARWLELHALEREVVSRAQLLARLTAEYTAADLAFQNAAEAGVTLGLFRQVDEVDSAVLYDPGWKRVVAYQRGAADTSAPVGPPHGALVERGLEVRENAVDVLQPVTYRSERLGWLHLSVSKARIRERAESYLWGLGLIALVLCTLSAGIAWLLRRLVSNPLLELVGAVDHVAYRADYSARVRSFGQSEIGQLSAAFNQMVAELERREGELKASKDALGVSFRQLAEAQAQLVKTERLAAVGEMGAVMAHEMRNSLGVVFNALESLSGRWEPPEEPRMMLQFLREEANRLNRIVEDLLNFAHPNPPQLELRAIEPVIASAIEVARGRSESAAKGARVHLEIAPDLPPVHIDERMIRQAIVNLVLNAFQAMPGGGEVRVKVTTRAREDGQVRLRIEVLDDGPGISPEIVPRLFQPFVTTKATGTGLGLAVVQRFVHAHDGSVSAIPGTPRGTTFSIELPCTK